MKKKLISILLAVVCLPMAAQVNVEASIDSMQILIGQQTRVTVTTTSRQDAKVVFPSYRPTEYITSGVEVLNMSDVQMKPIDNGMAHFVRVYTLTSFDVAEIITDFLLNIRIILPTQFGSSFAFFIIISFSIFPIELPPTERILSLICQERVTAML